MLPSAEFIFLRVAIARSSRRSPPWPHPVVAGISTNLFVGHLVSFLFAVMRVQYLLLSRKFCFVLLPCFETPRKVVIHFWLILNVDLLNLFRIAENMALSFPKTKPIAI